MNGYLLVDKPEGWTSHDVVAKIRAIIKTETVQKIKVGHTGTLDPMATGLLVLVLGKYTKQAAEFSKLDKTYDAELTLGQTSSTGDREGKLVQKGTRKPGEKEIKDALSTFLGQIEQVPPAFSAIKIGGQRAYKAARAGKAVEIEPRKVTIHSITNINYKYPKLAFTTSVSSGTYIRSLAVDIGEKLGTGAYLSSLRRTLVGKFDIKNALKIDNLSPSNIENHLQK